MHDAIKTDGDTIITVTICQDLQSKGNALSTHSYLCCMKHLWKANPNGPSRLLKFEFLGLAEDICTPGVIFLFIFLYKANVPFFAALVCFSLFWQGQTDTSESYCVNCGSPLDLLCFVASALWSCNFLHLHLGAWVSQIPFVFKNTVPYAEGQLSPSVSLLMLLECHIKLLCHGFCTLPILGIDHYLSKCAVNTMLYSKKQVKD